MHHYHCTNDGDREVGEHNTINERFTGFCGVLTGPVFWPMWDWFIFHTSLKGTSEHIEGNDKFFPL